jgi:CubicO group peptidase (beta-lactamase class C family)
VKNQQAVRDALNRVVGDGKVPAVAVAVVDRKGVLLVDAAGRRDVANNIAATPDTIFRIASMTKPVTSLAAMMLVDEAKLDLDDPVANYLPAFDRVRVLTAFDDRDHTFKSRPPVRPITIRHLLTHTSGIGYSFMDPRLAAIDDGRTHQADLPLLHDPGERFAYGPSTIVLGSVIEAITGATLGAVFADRIFEPLGMADTGFAVAPDRHRRAVTVHKRDAEALRETPNPPKLQSRGRGDDGLFSTVEDYGRFMRLFLNGGIAGGRRLLRESTAAAMTSNQIGALRIGEHPPVPGYVARPFPPGGAADGFGFGFQIHTQAPTGEAPMRSSGSYGWTGIFNTYFWIDPRKEIAVVVLMQFLPAFDDAAVDILHGVERLVYA